MTYAKLNTDGTLSISLEQLDTNYINLDSFEKDLNGGVYEYYNQVPVNNIYVPDFDKINYVSIGYGKVSNNGELMSAHTQLDVSWKPLEMFEKDINNNYYEFYNADGTQDAVKNANSTYEKLIANYKGLYLGVVDVKLKSLDYDSLATVKLWENDATFGAEATRILTWYKAIIAKNYELLNAGVVLTNEQYLAEISNIVF